MNSGMNSGMKWCTVFVNWNATLIHREEQVVRWRARTWQCQKSYLCRCLWISQPPSYFLYNQATPQSSDSDSEFHNELNSEGPWCGSSISIYWIYFCLNWSLAKLLSYRVPHCNGFHYWWWDSDDTESAPIFNPVDPVSSICGGDGQSPAWPLIDFLPLCATFCGALQRKRTTKWMSNSNKGSTEMSKIIRNSSLLPIISLCRVHIANKEWNVKLLTTWSSYSTAVLRVRDFIRKKYTSRSRVKPSCGDGVIPRGRERVQNSPEVSEQIFVRSGETA